MFKILIVILRMIFVLMPLCGISACDYLYSQSPSIKNNQAVDKISPSLYKVIQTLTVQGTEQAENYSSALIHVNEAGAIQVYIYVTAISEGLIEQLEENKVNIEIFNADYNIIQGWVSYDQIEIVAKIEEVEKITSPSYGMTMEDKWMFPY